jgi:hypothetical protein
MFYRYLRSLQRDVVDVGDDEQPPLSEVQVVALAEKVRLLERSLAQIVPPDAQLADIYSQLHDLVYTVNDLTHLVWSLRASLPKKFRPVEASVGVFNAVPWDLVEATNNARVWLPQYPNNLDEVYVVNRDSTAIDIDGNGKKVIDRSNYFLYTKGNSLHLKFLTSINQWVGL